MFMIDEIDKILNGFVVKTQTRKEQNKQDQQPKIRLADIEKFTDVSQLNSKLKWLQDEPHQSLTSRSNTKHRDKSISKLDYLLQQRLGISTDLLFLSTINELVLSQLTEDRVHENRSGSRVIICDRQSYNLLLKFRRLLSDKSLFPNEESHSNLLFKHPFNYNAIILISEVIEFFQRQQKSLLQRHYNNETKQNSYNFNYSLIRNAFPYLKMSDLVMMVMDGRSLNMGAPIDINGSREYLTLQMLNHFARSNELLEMKRIHKDLGIPHITYNDVLIIRPPDESWTYHNAGMNKNKSVEIPESTRLNPLKKLNLGHMVFLAEQLIRLADKLKLNLTSITHKSVDMYGQTRAFCQFVANKISNLPKNHIQGCRILVLDRLHSLRSALAHADRYGAFLEQESVCKRLGADVNTMLVVSLDNLDDKLQLVKLSQVLNSIIEYTVSLKPVKIDGAEPSALFSKSISTSNLSIQRHLSLLKTVCTAINEGYLLLVRLESNLMSLCNELALLSISNKPLDDSLLKIGERLVRQVESFKLLCNKCGQSIGATDILRVVLILMDVINSFQFTINEKKIERNPWSHQLTYVCETLFSEKIVKETLQARAKADHSGYGQRLVSNLDKILNRLLGYQRLSLDLEQTLVAFEADQLDYETQYNSLKLSRKDVVPGDALILLMLGPLTAQELSQLKDLDRSWKEHKKSIKNLYILTSGIVTSEDFVIALND